MSLWALFNFVSHIFLSPDTSWEPNVLCSCTSVCVRRLVGAEPAAERRPQAQHLCGLAQLYSPRQPWPGDEVSWLALAHTGRSNQEVPWLHSQLLLSSCQADWLCHAYSDFFLFIFLLFKMSRRKEENKVNDETANLYGSASQSYCETWCNPSEQGPVDWIQCWLIHTHTYFPEGHLPGKM